MGGGQLAAEDGHPAPHLAGHFVGPDMLLDVHVAFVREPAGVEINGVVHRGTGDVHVAAGVRVCGPVGLGDVFGVVGEDRVIAVVAAGLISRRIMLKSPLMSALTRCTMPGS